MDFAQVALEVISLLFKKYDKNTRWSGRENFQTAFRKTLEDKDGFDEDLLILFILFRKKGNY